jgi:hypothetical protein
MFPAIVIPAYNRPIALKRLLSSLQVAEYPPNVQIPLVISIDPENDGPNSQVRELAESFVWEHGPNDIKLHDKHLGLLENFYYCGGLTQVYGSVIFLEDDLFVSPAFYQYASHCLDFYEDEARVGGISLYCYNRNGFTHNPFIPLEDGTDVFFLQTASILGQAWSHSQWQKFADWCAAESVAQPESTDNMHDLWTKFDTDDYFPIVTKYLVSTDRFYVFPRVSYTTGFGDPGVHFADTTSYFQVPIQRGLFDNKLQHFYDSEAIYDSFMELSPGCFKRLVPSLSKLDFDVDLNAAKAMRNITAPYVITTRACKKPLKTFSLSMHPAEANIIFGVDGSGINLCRSSDILWDKWNELQTQHRLHHYFFNGQGSGLRKSAMHFLLDLINRFQ